MDQVILVIEASSSDSLIHGEILVLLCRAIVISLQKVGIIARLSLLSATGLQVAWAMSAKRRPKSVSRFLTVNFAFLYQPFCSEMKTMLTLSMP